MATYEKGDSYEDEISRIQERLGVTADGKFGTEMQKAARAWQRANGMKADGMVGPDMLLAFGLLDLVLLENGDEGELVKRVQEAVGVEPDGEYGKATMAAVRTFQKSNQLKANGVADLATLRALGVLDGGTQAAAPAAKPAATRPAPAAAPAPAIPTRPQSTANAGQRADRPKISSWAYQLADIDPKEITALDVDLVVIDYSADGEDATAFKTADLTRMKQRPSGGTKKVISYMSIGEAETYRYYWRDEWADKSTKPDWLDDENPEWEGNYKVRYWDPDWQAVIMGSPSAYLDRIMAAGFDGVYLDIIDAFEYWRDEKNERPDADKDMIAFVKKIAAYARKKRADFMIVPQNGEELLADASYRAAISAQGKEDVFYGEDGDGKANSKQDVAECLDCLAPALKEGIPVMVVEYLDDKKKIVDAGSKLAQLGCTAYFGPRDLDELRPLNLKA